MKVLNSHLVFQHPDPDSIPLPKKVAQGWVAVPHTLHAAMVLRAMGLDAPSPMSTEYEWPGRFKPYQHQIVTSEFLTLNKRAFCLSGMGCISGDAIISVNRRGKTQQIELRRLYERWINPGNRSLGNDYWTCRSLKGDKFGLNKVKDVMFKGYQQTLLFTLADGKTIRATPDHKMAQPDGSWVEAINLRVGDYLVTNGNDYVEVPCPKCGSPKRVKYYNRQASAKQTCKVCKSQSQSHRLAGSGNPAWKGGAPFIDKDEYVRVYLPDHHRADRHGRVYEHIVIAEKVTGEPITKEYHVHHENGVKHDNRPENLRVLLEADHHRQHDTYSHLDGSGTINGGKIVVLPKKSLIVSIACGGVVDVYDISMEAPHHNFVANGIVVHNSGKTLSALWAADYLKQQGVVNRVLIVSPLSTLDVVWGREIFTNFPHRSYAVLHGSSDKRKKLLKEPADFYILNHHGLKVMEQELIDRPDINLIIFDELAVLRNAQTGLWKSAKKILGPDRWAWGLTGSPTPQAPTDAFGLAKLLKPENVPFSFTRFKNDIMLQCGPFRWVPRKNAEQAVARVLSPSIRYALRDCVDLPETIVQYRTVEMTKEQKEHYTKLLKECVTEVRGNAVTAVNAAVLLGKLIQTSAGVLYGADGQVLKLDCEHRIAEVEEIIDECDEKVIVFVPLTGALHAVYNHLKKKYNCGLIEGDTSKHERQRVFDEVQYGEMKVLCANPQAMAHGISLTASSTIVYFAPPFSNEVYEQSAARIVRPGQKNVTNLIHLVSTKEELKIYKGLQEKKKFMDTVLDIVKEQ